MVKLNLKHLLDSKHISRYRFQKLTNWNYKRINAYYHGTVKLISVDEINTMCRILNCSINDLFEYKRDD